jgi:ankyrin repeat protein
MPIHSTEQTEIERYITKALSDVSKTNAVRLKPGLRVLMTTNFQTFQTVCSEAVQEALKDFKKILSHPETLAPLSCNTESDREDTLQFIKQFTLNNLNLLDDRTSILPNTFMVKKSIMEGERLKSVIHASALKNVITNAHYVDTLEKKFKAEGATPEQCSALAEKAIQSTHQLHKAVLEGNISTILKCLSVHGVDVNYPDEQGMTPLHLAVREELTETVKLLLTEPNININIVNNNGWTPLHIAARAGFADIVDALLTMSNIDPNSVNSDGWTALHWAAWQGSTDVVTVLLAAQNININQTDKTGMTPLHWAARNGHPDIITVLLSIPTILVNPQENEKRTPLHLAAMFSHEAAVLALLKSPKIELNLADMDGLTPLHWAARNGEEGILKALLAKKDIISDVLDNNSMTPLDWAKRNGHAAIIRLLSPTPKQIRRLNFWESLLHLFKKSTLPE